jgi:hypothetical protein
MYTLEHCRLIYSACSLQPKNAASDISIQCKQPVTWIRALCSEILHDFFRNINALGWCCMRAQHKIGVPLYKEKGGLPIICASGADLVKQNSINIYS